jgi:catechol 2,3-dioxygenase-like lactoylglutathione lyase family enzyme
VSDSQGSIKPVASAPDPIDPGVRIGHAHLRTADIDRIRAFYVDVLGFDAFVPHAQLLSTRGTNFPLAGHNVPRARRCVPRGTKFPPRSARESELGGKFVTCAAFASPRSTLFPLSGKFVTCGAAGAARATLFPPDRLTASAAEALEHGDAVLAEHIGRRLAAAE